jgi:hypothetical protein
MKNQTIPRGYRLKESTHRLIKKTQDELNLSQDKVISKAMRLYYGSIKSGAAQLTQDKNINKLTNK